jgi:hypothetical protein
MVDVKKFCVEFITLKISRIILHMSEIWVSKSSLGVVKTIAG